MEHELLLARVIASRVAARPCSRSRRRALACDGREATIELAGQALAVVAEEVARGGSPASRSRRRSPVRASSGARTAGRSRPPGVRRTSPTRPRPCAARTSCSRGTEAWRSRKASCSSGSASRASAACASSSTRGTSRARTSSPGWRRSAPAAHAVGRANGRATAELAQPALLAVVGQAIAELSLSHLETAVDRVGELLGTVEPVYLRQAGGLESAAERGLAGTSVSPRASRPDPQASSARPVVEVRDATTTLAWGRSETPSRSRGSSGRRRPASRRRRADRHARRVPAEAAARENESMLLAASRGSSQSQSRTPACTRTCPAGEEREALDADSSRPGGLGPLRDLARSPRACRWRRRWRDHQNCCRAPRGRTPPSCACPTSAANPPSPCDPCSRRPARRRARSDPAPAAAARPHRGRDAGRPHPARAKRLGGGHELLIPFLERGSTASSSRSSRPGR